MELLIKVLVYIFLAQVFFRVGGALHTYFWYRSVAKKDAAKELQ